MDEERRDKRSSRAQLFRAIGCFSVAVVALIGICGGIYYVLYTNPPASNVCRLAHEELSAVLNDLSQDEASPFAADRVLVEYFSGRNTWGFPSGWDVAVRNTDGSLSVAVTNPLRVDPIDPWPSTIHICDAQGQQIYTLRLPTSGIDEIAISPNEKFVALSNWAGVHILDIEAKHIEHVTTERIKGVTLSSDGSLSRP